MAPVNEWAGRQDRDVTYDPICYLRPEGSKRAIAAGKEARKVSLRRGSKRRGRRCCSPPRRRGHASLLPLCIPKNLRRNLLPMRARHDRQLIRPGPAIYKYLMENKGGEEGGS